MHHALQIQEILFDIFQHCCPQGLNPYHHKKATSDLAALARTCRAFKEPALSVLWRVLIDLSPLARCLPEASQRLVSQGNMYSFSRPLTQTDWDVLQSYTHRIRSIHDVTSGLNRTSVKTLSNPPTIGPLFPNLRVLRCEYAKKTLPLLQLPLPSLVLLHVEFENPQSFQNSLESFPKFSPNIRRISIRVRQPKATFSKIEPNYICRWQNLQSVDCPQLTLDVVALAHLSHVPTLTRLVFMLSATLPPSDSPLFFSNLRDLTLHSESLHPILRLLLSQTRLPAITDFSAFIGNCPSRREFSYFLAGVQTSGAGHSIQRLWLTQSFPSSSNVLRSEALLLGLEDLRPCMAFRNLRDVDLNIEWNVGLTDSEVLVLASTWPQLQRLLINADCGWNSVGGITPGGLIRLLQTCRSLSQIALALDTRGYTESPSSQAPANLGLTLPPTFSFNVLDSILEAESVPAVATFFSGIAACSDFSFVAWRGREMVEPPDVKEYKQRWCDVYGQVNQYSESGDSDIDTSSS